MLFVDTQDATMHGPSGFPPLMIHDTAAPPVAPTPTQFKEKNVTFRSVSELPENSTEMNHIRFDTIARSVAKLLIFTKKYKLYISNDTQSPQDITIFYEMRGTHTLEFDIYYGDTNISVVSAVATSRGSRTDNEITIVAEMNQEQKHMTVHIGHGFELLDTHTWTIDAVIMHKIELQNVQYHNVLQQLTLAVVHFVPHHVVSSTLVNEGDDVDLLVPRITSPHINISHTAVFFPAPFYDSHKNVIESVQQRSAHSDVFHTRDIQIGSGVASFGGQTGAIRIGDCGRCSETGSYVVFADMVGIGLNDTARFVMLIHKVTVVPPISMFTAFVTHNIESQLSLFISPDNHHFQIALEHVPYEIVVRTQPPTMHTITCRIVPKSDILSVRRLAEVPSSSSAGRTYRFLYDMPSQTITLIFDDGSDINIGGGYGTTLLEALLRLSLMCTSDRTYALNTTTTTTMFHFYEQMRNETLKALKDDTRFDVVMHNNDDDNLSRKYHKFYTTSLVHMSQGSHLPYSVGDNHTVHSTSATPHINFTKTIPPMPESENGILNNTLTAAINESDHRWCGVFHVTHMKHGVLPSWYTNVIFIRKNVSMDTRDIVNMNHNQVWRLSEHYAKNPKIIHEKYHSTQNNNNNNMPNNPHVLLASFVDHASGRVIAKRNTGLQDVHTLSSGTTIVPIGIEGCAYREAVIIRVTNMQRCVRCGAEYDTGDTTVNVFGSCRWHLTSSDALDVLNAIGEQRPHLDVLRTLRIGITNEYVGMPHVYICCGRPVATSQSNNGCWVGKHSTQTRLPDIAEVETPGVVASLWHGFNEYGAAEYINRLVEAAAQYDVDAMVNYEIMFNASVGYVLGDKGFVRRGIPPYMLACTSMRTNMLQENIAVSCMNAEGKSMLNKKILTRINNETLRGVVMRAIQRAFTRPVDQIANAISMNKDVQIITNMLMEIKESVERASGAMEASEILKKDQNASFVTTLGGYQGWLHHVESLVHVPSPQEIQYIHRKTDQLVHHFENVLRLEQSASETKEAQFARLQKQYQLHDQNIAHWKAIIPIEPPKDIATLEAEISRLKHEQDAASRRIAELQQEAVDVKEKVKLVEEHQMTHETEIQRYTVALEKKTNELADIDAKIMKLRISVASGSNIEASHIDTLEKVSDTVVHATSKHNVETRTLNQAIDQLDKVQREIDEMNMNIETSKMKITQLTSTLNEKNERIEQLNNEVIMKTREYDYAHKELQTNQRIVTTVTNEMELMTITTESMRKKLEEAEGRIAEAQRRLKESQDTIDMLRTEISGLNMDASAVNIDMKKHKDDVGALSDQLVEKNLEIQALKQHMETQQTLVEHANEQTAQCRDELQRTLILHQAVVQNKSTLEESVQKLKSERNYIDNTLLEYVQSLEYHKQQNERLLQDQQAIQSTIQSHVQLTEQLSAEKETLGMQLTMCRSTLNTLTQINEEQKTVNAALMEEIDMRKNNESIFTQTLNVLGVKLQQTRTFNDAYTEVVDIQQKHSETIQQVVKLNGELNDTRKQYEGKMHEIRELTSKRESDQALYERRVIVLQSAIDKNEQTVETLKSTSDTLRRKVKRIKKRKDRLITELKEKENALVVEKQARERLETIKKQLDDTNIEHEILTSTIKTKEEIIANMHNTTDELNATNAQLNALVETQNTEIKMYKEKLDSLRQKIKTTVEELENIKKQHTEERHSLESKVDNLSDTIATLQQNLSENTKTIANLNDQHTVAVQKLRTVLGQISDTLGVKTGDDDDDVSSLGNLIDVIVKNVNMLLEKIKHEQHERLTAIAELEQTRSVHKSETQKLSSQIREMEMRVEDAQQQFDRAIETTAALNTVVWEQIERHIVKKVEYKFESNTQQARIDKLKTEMDTLRKNIDDVDSPERVTLQMQLDKYNVEYSTIIAQKIRTEEKLSDLRREDDKARSAQNALIKDIQQRVNIFHGSLVTLEGKSNIKPSVTTTEISIRHRQRAQSSLEKSFTEISERISQHGDICEQSLKKLMDVVERYKPQHIERKRIIQQRTEIGEVDDEYEDVSMGRLGAVVKEEEEEEHVVAIPIKRRRSTMISPQYGIRMVAHAVVHKTNQPLTLMKDQRQNFSDISDVCTCIKNASQYTNVLDCLKSCNLHELMFENKDAGGITPDVTNDHKACVIESCEVLMSFMKLAEEINMMLLDAHINTIELKDLSPLYSECNKDQHNKYTTPSHKKISYPGVMGYIDQLNNLFPTGKKLNAAKNFDGLMVLVKINIEEHIQSCITQAHKTTHIEVDERIQTLNRCINAMSSRKQLDIVHQSDGFKISLMTPWKKFLMKYGFSTGHKTQGISKSALVTKNAYQVALNLLLYDHQYEPAMTVCEALQQYAKVAMNAITSVSEPLLQHLALLDEMYMTMQLVQPLHVYTTWSQCQLILSKHKETEYVKEEHKYRMVCLTNNIN